MAESNTPSELTEQMFATVGRAITQWSFVENDLSTLFGVCLGGAAIDKKYGYVHVPRGWNAMWLFYSVENWRAKLQLLDAAIEAHLLGSTAEKKLKAEWAKLSDKASDLARKRNKLAHWFVRPAQRSGTGAEHEPIAPARLCPPYGSPKYYRETGFNPPGVALTEKQVRELDTAFSGLAEKVRRFTKKVAKAKEPRDKDVLLALDLLLSDGRLDPPLLKALERALSSLP